MSNRIIKGSIEEHNRYDSYDDDGIKIINYWIKINGEKYTVGLRKNSDVYFEDQFEVVLLVDENNKALAGLCPKKNIKWGNTGTLKSHITDADAFELMAGRVLEKRRESFTVNKGTSSFASYSTNSRTVVNYTIVLPDKRFRVAETIGKHIRPNTDIVALTSDNVAFVIKDNTANKIYGKPRMDYIIALFLWIAFNAAMVYASVTNQKAIFVSYNTVLIIGNLVFGLAFLFSFSAFLSASKTMRIFKQMLNNKG